MPKALNTQLSSTYGPIYDSTIRKADIVLDAAAKAGHQVVRIYGYNTTPDHNNRQCVDFMGTDGKKPVDHAMMDWLVDYCKKNARVLGVEGIIWNRRVMGFPSQGSAYRGPEGGWRPYSGGSQHTDHVHVQFNRSSVAGQPSTVGGSSSSSSAGKLPTSGEVYLDKLKPGSKDSDSVRYWQAAMNALSFKGGTELKITGNYNSKLEHETKLFQQQKCDDKPDGWPGPKQATYGFQLAKKELKSKGVKTLSIYRDSVKGGLVEKVW